MKCPNCGAANLVSGTRDLPYAYKGATTSIPDVTGDYCPACGEGLLQTGESVRIAELMAAFNKQVDADVVDPANCR